MPDDTPSPEQPLDTDDPLLTSAQAAQRMGKTYRQFTAYASHHKALMPREGDPPLYRLSVIDAAIARSRKPVNGLSVAPHRETPQRQTEQSAEAPSVDKSAQVVELARQVIDLSLRNDRLHERLHDKDAEIQGLLAEAARREAEHRAELDSVRAEYEQRRAAEAEKKAVSWWGRLLGRG